MSSVSVLEILPVAIAYNPDFVAFKKKFDDVIEEIEIDACDYEFRRSTRERYEKKSRKMGFLILDLKDYIKKYMNNYGDIVFKGNVYKYQYIRKTNTRVKNYYKDLGCYRNIYKLILQDKYATNYFIKLYNLKKKTELTELEPNMDYNFIYEFLNLEDSKEVKKMMIDYLDATSDKYDEQEGFVLRVKYLYKKLDYKGIMRRYWSPSNLKYWNKTTMVVSSKGLKADTTWSYSDKNYRGGWRFGGITAVDLEHFCKKNGFKTEKGKKYQYGDYANWFLHILE